MARSTTAASSARRPARSRSKEAAAEPVGLELVGVVLCLGSVLVAAALATLAPAGAEGGLRNVTGAVGRHMAQALTAAVGMGAWVLPAFGLAWGVRCLRGERPEQWARKAALVPVLMALTSIEAALLFKQGVLPGLERVGPGGYFGLSMGTVTSAPSARPPASS